jgi:hypothetical protein
MKNLIKTANGLGRCVTKISKKMSIFKHKVSLMMNLIKTSIVLGSFVKKISKKMSIIKNKPKRE